MLRSTPESFARRLLRPATFFVTLSLAVSTTAASVVELLPVRASAGVTRGVFLQVAMTALDLPIEKGRRTLPYQNVSTTLQPFVQTADTLKALGVFGADLQLERVITRGEAAELLHVLSRTPKPAIDRSFTDAATAARLSALRFVVGQKWMTPKTDTEFGAAAPLTSREARLLVSRMTRTSPLGRTTTRVVTIDTSALKNTGKTTTKPTVKNEDVVLDVWRAMHTEYLYGDKFDTDAAIRAMVESAGDPYTEYMTPKESTQFHDQLHGSFEGIGAVVESQSGTLIVQTPFKNSPAQKAGLRPKDIIRKVDGRDIGGMTSSEAVSFIRGPRGSVVVLTIQRNGNTFDVPVTRQRIEIPVVETEVIDGVPVFKIAQFLETTAPALQKAIQQHVTPETRGIVLDFRNNPGGLLGSAGDVLGTIVPRGTVYFVGEARSGEHIEKTSGTPVVSPQVKIVALINEGSASAAEVAVGTLQDLKRATVVGEKSFGKGSAQRTIMLRNGGELKFTYQEWYTPNRRPINKIGLQPDIAVKNTSGRDDQLLKAIDLLK